MTLDNLIGISLERIKPDPTAITRLLEAAERNIIDAELIAHKNLQGLAFCKLTRPYL
jgi:hypothetical protein